MQIGSIILSDKSIVTQFSYEPADISPASYMFSRWECGLGCGPLELSLRFLVNSIEDFNTVFSSLRSGARDAPEGEEQGAYARRRIQAFYDGLLDLEAQNGGSFAQVSSDQITALLKELNEHVSFASPGVPVGRTHIGGYGTIHDYLADDENQELMLAMLGLYHEDTIWMDALGPEPATVRSRIEGKKALTIPGDEDLVALAINLYNLGAYEVC